MHLLIRKINEKKKKRNININLAVLPSHDINARREKRKEWHSSERQEGSKMVHGQRNQKA